MARKRTQDFYTEIDQIADREAFLESVQDGFSEIADPRVSDNQTYPLVHLLVMIVCAILSLIEVTSFRTVGDKTTEERRFYISDLELTPDRAGHLARSHWSIENRLHWIMDVNFGDDASLASVGNAAENLAVLKRMASTMIRIDLGGIRGTAQRRRQASWDDSWALRLLSRIFEMSL